MDSLDYWRMCDDLSVIQCILLILGADPRGLEVYVETYPAKRPEGYEAVSTAVKNAVLRGKLRAHVVKGEWDSWTVEVPPDAQIATKRDGTVAVLQNEPDWLRTTVAVDDLKVWLSGRNVTQGFFFTQKDSRAPYLDSSQKTYAPKLAAAIAAWEAVTSDPALTRKGTVKNALTVWLNKNAARFGLVKKDGTPNNLAIEEAAKVANWNSKGGAPKTPSQPTHPRKAA